MAGLILDTCVVIAAGRRRLDLKPVIAGQEVGLPAIVVAEYLRGVLTDPDPARAEDQEAFLRDLVRVVPVVDYDLKVARVHAALLVHTRARGEPRGPHDLIIAATARSGRRTVVTTDAEARFGDLPDVMERLL